MGNTPSNSSPLTSEAMNSPLISQPRSLGGHTRPTSTRPRASAPSPRDSDPSDVLLAPPPYTPVAEPQEVPPQVPPRDTHDIRRTTSAVASNTPPPRPHRRTVSHSHPTRPTRPSRTPQSPSIQSPSIGGQAPGDGVGGFIAPQNLPHGTAFTRANSTASRPQDATTATRTDATTLAALTSRRASHQAQTSATSSTSNVGVRPQNVATPRHETPTRRNSKENPLDLLRKFDTVIIVDDSSSMEGALWIEARDALAGIADAAARYDTTGIDLHFLNDRRVGRNLKSATRVKQLFDDVTPCGITPTGEKLEELLLDYLLQLESAETEKPKPVNFVILTDGAPSERPVLSSINLQRLKYEKADDPESVIVTAAKRLDEQHAPISQVGIQFVQLGSDPDATEALQELDDELANKHNIRDMVDTTLYTGQQLTAELLGKILLGGVNRRVDKKGFQL